MKSEKKLEIVEKKIYICPNNSTQNRNVRIDDNGTEIILDHVLNPWIIANIFKIKKPSPDAMSVSGTTSSTIDQGQYLKLKTDLNNLRKEMSLMSSKLRRRKPSVEIHEFKSK